MTSSRPHEPVIIGIVSAYRAPGDLGGRLQALLRQLDRVIVVDDGSHSTAHLRELDPRIDVIELDVNAGIAAALNAGIARARTYAATHVVTLDQDSALAEGYVKDAAAHLDRLIQDGLRPAAVVPETFGSTRVVTDRRGVPLDPIQSGQLVPMSVFDQAGGFLDNLFIDSVDTEFTLRARSHGYEFFILPGSTLDHALGDQTPIRVFGRHLVVFGKPRHLNYHAPFRTYYIVRNGFALWRLHRRGNLSWLLRRTAAMVWAVTLSSALSPDRSAQFRAVRFGLRDAFRGRLGKIPAKDAARLGSKQAKPTRENR